MLAKMISEIQKLEILELKESIFEIKVNMIE